MQSTTRRSFIAACGAAAGLALLGGCSSAAQGSSSGSSQAAGGSGKPSITVGTLATEDILPLWVAESDGLYAGSGLDVSIVTFQSATELIAGVSSGEVNLAMTDIMVTASMFAGGTDVQMEWVTLGTTPQQGRFGIMVGPNSSVRSLTELAGIPIGVGSNTILEYVMDRLMESAGVPDDKILVEELQKLPVRYQAMLEGEVAAAALPGTLLALGESSGCHLVADDTTGDNISQSVMIARGDFTSSDAGRQQIERLEDIWDDAAARINANPEAYRGVLVANANLPEAIAGTYPISEYPLCQLPTAEMVDPVLDWMKQKGYLTKSLSYNAATGTFS